ncbi:MAG: hypothetical protein ACTHOG_13845 [Marmoricola sp.]
MTLVGCGSGSRPAATGGYTPAMTAALEAANRIAVHLTTFDYRHLDAFYATLRSEGTANLNQSLQATRADITAYDQRLKVISTGRVVASAAKPAASDGSVTILLFVDQRLRSAGAKAGLIEHARVQMVMRDAGGTWLADEATVTGSS